MFHLIKHVASSSRELRSSVSVLRMLRGMLCKEKHTVQDRIHAMVALAFARKDTDDMCQRFGFYSFTFVRMG